MRTRATTTLTTALLLALSACSSGDDSTDAEPPAASSSASSPAAETSAAPADPTADDDGLTETVQAYTKAYFAGEASKAYGMLSERCQKKANELVFGAAVDQAAKEYGPDHPATDVKAEVSGELARVSYKVEGLPKFDQDAQPWAREGGVWKYDAC